MTGEHDGWGNSQKLSRGDLGHQQWRPGSEPRDSVPEGKGPFRVLLQPIHWCLEQQHCSEIGWCIDTWRPRPHLRGYFETSSFFYAVWPFVHMQTHFQVTQNRAFGKLFLGWRFFVNSALLLLCLRETGVFGLSLLFVYANLSPKQQQIIGTHNQSSASFNFCLRAFYMWPDKCTCTPPRCQMTFSCFCYLYFPVHSEIHNFIVSPRMAPLYKVPFLLLCRHFW